MKAVGLGEDASSSLARAVESGNTAIALYNKRY